MASQEEIRIIIKAMADNAIRELQKLDGKLGDTKKAGVTASQSIGSAFGAAAGQLLAFTGAIGGAYQAFIKPASELEETTAKFNTVFSYQKDLADEWTKTLVKGYAMSTNEAKKYLSAVMDLLNPMGMNANQAAKMSFEVTKLAADLGSFNNLPTEQVMMDIQSALVGNYETMKKYGVVLNEETIKQNAFNQKLWNGKGIVDASTKAQVAFQLMLKGSVNAIGDMARTSDSFANTIKRVQAGITDFRAEVGSQLLPVVTELITALEENDDMLSLIKDTFYIIGTVIGGVITIYTALLKVMNEHRAIGDVLSVLNPFEFMIRVGRDALDMFKDLTGEAKKFKVSLSQDLIAGFKGVGESYMRMVEDTKVKRRVASMQEVNENKRKSEQMIQLELDWAKKVNEVHATAKEKNYDFTEALAMRQRSLDAEYQKEMNNLQKISSNGRIEKEKYELAKKEIEDYYRAERERLDEESYNKQIGMYQSYLGAAQQVLGAVGNVASQYFKNQNIAIDNDYKKRKAAIMANVKDEEEQKKQLEALDEEYQKKKADAAYKAAVYEKANSLIAAIINTALGVTTALSAKPPGFGIALAGIIGALGAAQVALIARQPIPKMAMGGIIPGSAGGTLIRAGEGGRAEAIIPLTDNRAQDQLGGMGGNINVNFQVETMLASDDLPPKIAEKIDVALYKLFRDRKSRFASAIGA